MPRVTRRFPVACFGFLVTVEFCYCPLTLQFALGNLSKGHMFNFNYVKREGISIRQPNLRYYGGPTVEPEEGFFRGDRAVDYLRGPRPIIGTV